MVSRYRGILSQLPSDLIAVFVGVYAFLIYGLVSIADTHFIHRFTTSVQCCISRNSIQCCISRTLRSNIAGAEHRLRRVSPCARQSEPGRSIDPGPASLSIGQTCGRSTTAADRPTTHGRAPKTLLRMKERSRTRRCSPWPARSLVTCSFLRLRKLVDREEEAPWPSISSRSLCSS